jgi:hypothetical protein
MEERSLTPFSFHYSPGPYLLQAPPHPSLVLNAEGTILKISGEARRLLEYDARQSVIPCFFSHVHGKSLYRVMRDLTQMIFEGRPSANWRLWLRKGTGRWGWYHAAVQNRLSESDEAILVFLQDTA